jgi:hypothetical protein
MPEVEHDVIAVQRIGFAGALTFHHQDPDLSGLAQIGQAWPALITASGLDVRFDKRKSLAIAGFPIEGGRTHLRGSALSVTQQNDPAGVFQNVVGPHSAAMTVVNFPRSMAGTA